MKEIWDKIKASKLYTTQIAGVPLLYILLGVAVVGFFFLSKKMKARRRRRAILRRARAIKKRKRSK